MRKHRKSGSPRNLFSIAYAKSRRKCWCKTGSRTGKVKLRVRSAVETVLNTHLPESYDRVVFTEKCNNVFDLMLNQASQGLKWAA